jgi:hypothetical protein
MNSSFDLKRRSLLTLAMGLPCASFTVVAQTHSGHQSASINAVLDFRADTWPRLLKEGPRPAAYVFTTTYCSTCPDVFDLLRKTVNASRKNVELAAVLMDAQGDRALMHARHYEGMTRLYAFDGFEPEIRHAVDPKWRDITPYVVLIDRQGKLQRVIGPPDQKRLEMWLA